MAQLLDIHDAEGLGGADRRRGVSVDAFRDLRCEKRGGKTQVPFFFFSYRGGPTKTFLYFGCKKSRLCSNELNSTFSTVRLEEERGREKRCASEQFVYSTAACHIVGVKHDSPPRLSRSQKFKSRKKKRRRKERKTSCSGVVFNPPLPPPFLFFFSLQLLKTAQAW